LAEENNEDTLKKKSNNKWFLYTIAAIPIMAVLSSFLIIKLVNPMFSSSSGEYSDQPMEHKVKDGFLCQVGTILVNPSGMDRRRIIKVGIIIEVNSQALFNKVEKTKPKLQHHAVMILSSKDIEAISSNEGKIELQIELKKAFINELGLAIDDIRQVYFNDFVIQ